MASERDLELLDDYIGNRLDPNQRLAFEQKLESDSQLRSEHSFQQKIAESIRKARTAELKTMLNNVTVASGQLGNTSIVTKIAGIAVVLSVAVTGIYYYLAPADTAVHEQPITVNKSKEEPSSTEGLPATPPKKDTPVEENMASQGEEPKATGKESDTKIDRAGDEEKGQEPSLDLFDPAVDEQSTSSEPTPTWIENATAAASTITVITDSNNKKFTFHYQFKEDKLFLYGTFEKNLYEILEFFTDNKQTIFLLYKNNYYLLDESNEKIKPLAPINDATLLKKLKEYRGN